MTVTPARADPTRPEVSDDHERPSTRKDHAHGMDGNEADGRSRADRRSGLSARLRVEWITLALSSLIVLTPVALTTYLHVTSSRESASVEVEAQLAEVYQVGSRYYLPVTVRNTGGQTGEDVRVRIVMTAVTGQQESAELLIAFLSSGGSSRGVAAFTSDPRHGQITAGVVSFLEP
jgi:uncharacterized protein (TIGR02588 family)